MPKRFIDPCLEELSTLRTPLTAGEREVLTFLDQHLPTSYEIYVQPHLNGYRPDFVVLSETGGVAVFEVKDWDLNALQYQPVRRNNRWELWASDGARLFSRENENPVSKIDQYRSAIQELFCPELAVQGHTDPRAKSVVTGGIIMARCSTASADALFQPFRDERGHSSSALKRYYPLAGAEVLSQGAIHLAFPAANFRNRWMTSAIASALRRWLLEPSSSKEQRQPLAPDQEQARILGLTPTKSGMRRIKGPAGSGKSQLLAIKAARSANIGKDVLFVYFNITLGHFLHDLTQRAALPSEIGRRTRDRVTYLHFNEWCKRQCELAGLESDYRALIALVDQASREERERIFAEDIPALTRQALDLLLDTARYDVVLVDEGQDFRAHWWDLLRRARKADGELWLVADQTQDIYGRAATWTEQAMTGSGFVGPWARINVNHRCPPAVVPTLREWARLHLTASSIDVPEQSQNELDLSPVGLFWVDVSSERLLDAAAHLVAHPEYLFSGLRYAQADCTLLVQNHQLGLQLEKKLVESYAVRCCSVFAEHPLLQKPKKMAFWMGDARVKASTYESFKGWEARLLIGVITNLATERDALEIYIGLSRLRCHPDGSMLIVVNSVPQLYGFGGRTGWQCLTSS